MSRLALAAAVAAAASAAPPAVRRAEVRILAFSDYHSHAVPFRSEGRNGQGGIARAVALFKEARRAGRALVLSGGDMLNEGVPAWSDEYGCVEWPWLDGLVDAMALGNHDLDYGAEAFAKCHASTRVPILCANLVDTDDRPWLTAASKPYLVREVGGVRIGAFAVAGAEVQRLIAPVDRPPHTRWLDAVETARGVVAALRGREKVAAVVLIGHQTQEEDEALARAVPGIDLVLGTHSHRKSALTTIPGTATRYIAPYQYLAYVSDVRLTFEEGRLADVEGRLLALDGSRPEDPGIAARVAALQRQLRARRPERFEIVGRTAFELSDAGVSERESLVGNWATDVLRARAGTHVFSSTASSFRAGLPPGEVTREDFLSALPYRNHIARVRLTGQQIADWLSLSASRRGSDLFSQVSGARYTVRDGRADDIEVLKDPVAPEKGWAPLDLGAEYLVGTTDYQAMVAAGYREIFSAGRDKLMTAVDVHDTLLEALKKEPAAARLDGRTK